MTTETVMALGGSVARMTINKLTKEVLKWYP